MSGGTGGYDDFGSGMDIKITDEHGQINASGRTMSLDELKVGKSS